jgi:hypothetical protein
MGKIIKKVRLLGLILLITGGLGLAQDSFGAPLQVEQVVGIPNATWITLDTENSPVLATVENWGPFLMRVVSIGPGAFRGYSASGSQLTLRFDEGLEGTQVSGRLVYTNDLTEQKTFEFRGRLRH